ncbi:MAG: outer membrane protein assembly factor BamC [Wenzhouxiangellaceae bacterium]|nr:outer membrane protein assembly factor BamC [Wenzhouxiangellaceae bacterium]
MNPDSESVRFLPRCLLLLAVLPLLAACGVFGDRQPVYATSAEVEPIEVPPDLDPPETRSVYEIPGYSLPELAARGDESRPPRVPTSQEAEQARSRIRFGPTGLYLEVDDEASSVWRRLGFALNRDGMSVQEVIEDERRFRVRFDHEPIRGRRSGFFERVFLWWKEPESIDYRGTYVFEVQRETGERTRVAILDAEGNVLPMERAEFVLDRLRHRLG